MIQKTKTDQQINKNPNEIGCAFQKFNKNNIEYLSIKLELDGQTHYLKAFLNGKQNNDRQPKYLIFKSNPQNNYDENVINDNRSNIERNLNKEFENKRLTKLD